MKITAKLTLEYIGGITRDQAENNIRGLISLGMREGLFTTDTDGELASTNYGLDFEREPDDTPMDEELVSSLVRQIDQHKPGSDPEADLDELVHDIYASMAATVNNGGLAEQVRFLLRNGVSPTDILGE